jgi:hypothetical protein
MAGSGGGARELEKKKKKRGTRWGSWRRTVGRGARVCWVASTGDFMEGKGGGGGGAR